MYGDQPPIVSSNVFAGMAAGATDDVGPMIVGAWPFGFTGAIRTPLSVRVVPPSELLGEL